MNKFTVHPRRFTRDGSPEESGITRVLHVVAREDGVQVRKPEMAVDDLGEDVAEVGRDRKIASFVSLFAL